MGHPSLPIVSSQDFIISCRHSDIGLLERRHVTIFSWTAAIFSRCSGVGSMDPFFAGAGDFVWAVTIGAIVKNPVASKTIFKFFIMFPSSKVL